MQASFAGDIVLTLARKPEQSIYIYAGDQCIRVKVIRIESLNRVYLGFEANPLVRIVREELLEHEHSVSAPGE